MTGFLSKVLQLENIIVAKRSYLVILYQSCNIILVFEPIMKELQAGNIWNILECAGKPKSIKFDGDEKIIADGKV